MFSSDKNIETIAQLVEQLKQYGGLKLEMLKLDATEKTVKIISALILGFVLKAVDKKKGIGLELPNIKE